MPDAESAERPHRPLQQVVVFVMEPLADAEFVPQSLDRRLDRHRRCERLFYADPWRRHDSGRHLYSFVRMQGFFATTSSATGLAALAAGLAADELIEVAPFAAGGLFLNDKGQLLFVELLEELLPGDLLQASLAAIPGEVEPEEPGV